MLLTSQIGQRLKKNTLDLIKVEILNNFDKSSLAGVTESPQTPMIWRTGSGL